MLLTVAGCDTFVLIRSYLKGNLCFGLNYSLSYLQYL